MRALILFCPVLALLHTGCGVYAVGGTSMLRSTEATSRPDTSSEPAPGPGADAGELSAAHYTFDIGGSIKAPSIPAYLLVGMYSSIALVSRRASEDATTIARDWQPASVVTVGAMFGVPVFGLELSPYAFYGRPWLPFDNFVDNHIEVGLEACKFTDSGIGGGMCLRVGAQRQGGVQADIDASTKITYTAQGVFFSVGWRTKELF